MVAILLHDTIDAELDGLGRETTLTEIAETFGEISLYGFLILVTLTITTFVPYRLWRWTHKFIGGFFALSAFHYIFIMKPFKVVDPVGLYVLGFCVLGIVCYLYTQLLYARLQGRHAYIVEEVKETGGAKAVTLRPVNKGIRHRAGQFAFLQFQEPDIREVHPFTISKAPDDDRLLRFTIKPLGDFTAPLGNKLKTGMAARISGPYGHFRPAEGASDKIWIAAGIGITPFMAVGQALNEKAAPVHLFYCVRDAVTAPHLEELRQLDAVKTNFHLHLVESASQGRLKVNYIVEVTGTTLSKSGVYFCGPVPMREALRRDLKAQGMVNSKFHYEEFEIRSGVGLRKIGSWAYRNLVPNSLARER
jgi:predicted ferric reductase